MGIYIPGSSIFDRIGKEIADRKREEQYKKRENVEPGKERKGPRGPKVERGLSFSTE